MKKYIYFLALALLAASCVYPYDYVPDSSVDNIVIEGDILLGEKSYFQVSRVQALDSPYNERRVIEARVIVEGDNGYTKEGEGRIEGNEYVNVVDLTDIRYEPGQASASYRLRVVLDNALVNSPFGAEKKEYVSEWIRPEGDLVLDNLSYAVDRGKEELAIRMSLHSGGASKHFRYSYEEDWEFTTYNRASTYYQMPDDGHPNGQVLDFGASANTYYCWKHAVSRGINLATTEDMSEDRLVDYPFKFFKPNDQKMSIMYRIDLTVYPVSEGSYKYYENLKSISSFTGDLFSPIPSAMKGNLSCTTDPDEIVYGYIAVVFPKKAILYVSDEDADFYKMGKNPYEFQEEVVDSFDYLKRYLQGWRPYYHDFLKGQIWGYPAECLDCTKLGGTKNKPADWPTSHI